MSKKLKSQPYNTCDHLDLGNILLTTGEIARICKVSVRTVAKWIDSKALDGFRLPTSKDRRVSALKLLSFMKENKYPLSLFYGEFPQASAAMLFIVPESPKVIIVANALREMNYDIHMAHSVFSAGEIFNGRTPAFIVVDLDHIDRDEDIMKMIENKPQWVVRVIGYSSRLTEGQVIQTSKKGFDIILSQFTVRGIMDAIVGQGKADIGQ